MVLSIHQSVGVGGINRSGDVKLIQVLLNTFSAWKSSFTTLKVDGRIGKNTNNAIRQYQREAVGMIRPDGRVDRNGTTFRYLTMYLKPEEVQKIRLQARTGKMMGKAPVIDSTRIAASAGLKGQTVTYKSTLGKSKQIVSEYSKQVIRMALKEAGMSHAVITSTIRTPKEQARTMLRNAKINLTKQYQLYGSSGDKVLEVYEKNKSKPENEVVDLMVAKIEELAKQNRRVSKHCVTEDVYKKTNVIDIGYNSTKSVSKNFDADKFTAALKKLKKDGYIATVIDETKKSNKAWHIEVKVNKKALPKYEENTILNIISWINKLTAA